MATQWNSTFDMLVFALEYHKAINRITGDRDMRKYELLEEEWGLVQQLCDVLQVHFAHVPPLYSNFCRFSRMQLFSFLVQHPICPP